MSVLFTLVAYACGAIPTGVLLTRSRGLDLRQTGSGNIGAANVARTAGISLGLTTLVLDALKGAAPVGLARALTLGPATAAAAGVAAVLGHVFPITLGFRGGKGVATAAGALAVLAPGAALVCLAVFLATFAVWRYVSLASLAGALAAPLAAGLLGYPREVQIAATLIAVLISFRHQENLVRLRAGVEPRFALPKKQASPRN